MARDNDRTRPLISSGPPMTSFFCAIVMLPFQVPCLDSKS
jgi:hypothetical protein